MSIARVALTISAVVSLALPCAAQIPTGSRFKVESSAADEPVLPAVAVERSSGRFVVMWQRADDAIFAQRFDAAGVPVGRAFQSDDDEAFSEGEPSIARDGMGNYMVVWQDPDGSRLMGRRFASTGAALGPEMTLHEGEAVGASVAGSTAGFAVVWSSSNGIEGLRIGADGNRLGAVFSVDAAAKSDSAPVVGMDDSGAFVIAWSDGGVVAQRFISLKAGTTKDVAATTSEGDAPIARAEAAALNDNFADRIVINNVRYVHVANNSAASTEIGEKVPACAPNYNSSVWYEFIPPATGSYIFTTVGSSFNTVLAVYTGSPTLTQVGCNDDVTGSQQARIQMTLNAGTSYYIQLSGRGGSNGDFKFFVVAPADAVIPGAPTISAVAPGAPFPPLANAARTSNLAPVVAWAPSATGVPNEYLVQVSTSATFASIAASMVVSEPGRYWQVSPNLPAAAGQIYYWRVYTRNFLGQAGAASAAYTFTVDTVAPAAPALNLPAVNSAVSTLRPMFTWAAVTGATAYVVRVTSNFSCSTTVVEAEVATTTYTPVANMPQGEYWFCVQARDAAGNWSGFVGEKRRFVVNLSTAPLNGAQILAMPPGYSPNVTLTWATAGAGATYNVQVATDSSFTVLAVDSAPQTTTSYTMTGQGIGTYYWRVTVNGQAMPMSLARNFSITPALPTAPGIEVGGITNGAATNDLFPVFNWTVPANWATPAPGQSVTYQLQVATNSTFTALVETVSGIPTSDYTWTGGNAALAPATTYYWRVRAVTNLSLPGAYSAAYSFKTDVLPPVAPTLKTPALNALLTTPRPAFSWNAVPDAVRYALRVATDSGCTNSILGADVEVTTATHTATTNVPQGEYWYCVQARDAAGNWSDFVGEKRRFAVNYSLTPADDAVIVASAPSYLSNVTLTWSTVPATGSATTFRVQVATEPSFAAPVAQSPVQTSTSYIAAGLPIGTYYWRVLVNGQPVVPASLVRTFSVTSALPTAPAIQVAGALPGALTNGVQINHSMPVFDWTVPANWLSPPPGASITFELQVSTNSTFTALVQPTLTGILASDYTWTPPGDAVLTNGTTYYWRVRAVTDLGLPGAYSAAYSFKVDLLAPPAPALKTPVANGLVSALRPTFTWNAVTDAKRYRVRVATDALCITPIGSDIEITTTTYTLAYDLPQQGDYFFCVEARDAAGNWSGFGEVRRFMMNLAISPAPDAAIVVAAPAYKTNVVLKWTPVPNATYRVQIARDGDNSFTGDVLDTGIIAATTYTMANQGVCNCYWRVIVNEVAPAPGLYARFSVTPALPAAPLIDPASVHNGGITNSTTPTIAWTVPSNYVAPVAGVSVQYYEVQLSTTTTFATIYAEDLFHNSNSWVLNLVPSAGTTYYWRVRAVTSVGARGAYSYAYSFKVDTEDPGNPGSLTAPADNAVLTSARPAFSWPAGTNGATRYHLQIDDANDFSAPFYEVVATTISHTPTMTLPMGVYYWRLFALDAAGNEADTPTAFRQFTIDYRTAPIAGKTFASPTGVPIAVSFTWMLATGAPAGTQYTIEIDSNSDGVADTTAGPVTTALTSKSLAPGIYQYRLVANNGLGTSGWRSFTITGP